MSNSEAIVYSSSEKLSAKLASAGFTFDPATILLILKILLGVMGMCMKKTKMSPKDAADTCKRPGLLRRIQLTRALSKRKVVKDRDAPKVADVCFDVGATMTEPEMEQFQYAAKEVVEWDL